MAAPTSIFSRIVAQGISLNSVLFVVDTILGVAGFIRNDTGHIVEAIDHIRPRVDTIYDNSLADGVILRQIRSRVENDPDTWDNMALMAPIITGHITGSVPHHNLLLGLNADPLTLTQPGWASLESLGDYMTILARQFPSASMIEPFGPPADVGERLVLEVGGLVGCAINTVAAPDGMGRSDGEPSYFFDQLSRVTFSLGPFVVEQVLQRYWTQLILPIPQLCDTLTVIPSPGVTLTAQRFGLKSA